MESTIKDLRLLTLRLNNFKGLRSFEFNPDGKSASVYGDNETGKTTLADALTWLLFDKDTMGRSTNNMGIKTRVNGQTMHDREHSVEGVFNLITLRKVYKENWVTRRGSSETELAGHTTDYYVDDVKVKMSEYTQEIEKIMSEELFKILTTPTYFAESMHWTKRQEVLLELFSGEINTEDILSENPELHRYPEVLGDRTEEKQREWLKQRKKKLNEQVSGIPDRIDENTRKIEEVEDVEQARIKSSELNNKKEKLYERLSEVKSGGGITDLKVKVQDIEAQKRELKNEHEKHVEERLSDVRDKVSEIQDKVDKTESEYRKAKRKAIEKEDLLTQAHRLVEDLQNKLELVKGLQPKPESDNKPEDCPYCGRPMQKESEHDYQKYLEEFNQDKAERLKEKKEELAKAQSAIKEHKMAYEEAKDSAAKLSGRLEQRKQALEKAESELSEKKKQAPPVEETEQWKNLSKQQDELQKKIDEESKTRQDQVHEIKVQISEIDDEIEKASKIIQQAEQNKKIMARIQELEEKRRSAVTKLEQVESDLQLIEDFVRARSHFISDRVNQKFDLVNWKLFEEQINGGLNDQMCDPVYKGVPFSEGLNNAGRIQAGIDIIKTLSRHYGVSAPVFIDNRESVVRIPDNDLQIISLFVDPSRDKLHVEIEAEQEYLTV